jgi:SagB-type dehydrogenase family enzyme
VLLTGAGCFGREADTALHIHRATGNGSFGAVGNRPARPVGGPFKEYSDAPSRELDQVAELADISVASAASLYQPAQAFSAKPLTLDDLGSILFYANGVTARREHHKPPLLLRSAPSAGALYASELYIVALNVIGLDAGVYYYDVRKHGLLAVSEAPSMDALSAALDLETGVAHAPAYVAVSNVFDRYQWKYANRGYRYALVDTGHIGENLRLSATALQVRERPLLRFADDALNEMVAVDGTRESVCAVHALGHTVAGAQPWRSARSLSEQGESSWLPGGLKGRATRRFHEATKLVRGAGTVSPPSPVGDGEPAAVEAISLPHPALATGRALGEALVKRRSPANFSTAPITFAELAALFVTMRPRVGDGVEPYVIVHAVDSLDPGLYRYEAGAHRVSLITAGDLRDALADTCIGQKKARDAAVSVLMVVRLGDAMARDGRRAYRDLLIRSGELGQLVYLAAESLGLRARNLAAFRDQALNDLLSLDGERLAVAHLTLFGHAA